MEVFREDTRGRHETPTLARLYRGAGYPGIAGWPVLPFAGTAPRDAIAWETAGSVRVGSAIVDRYRLHHSGGLVVPLVHVRRDARQQGRVLLRVSLDGKVRPADWAEVQTRLDEGHEVVSFDPRGLGETRLRYRAESIDDPALAPKDDDAAYRSPLSGVLANHVYNAQLLGRPYLLEMIEDVEIAVRFAREQLDAREVAIEAPGEAHLLGRAAATALPDLELVPSSDRDPSFGWKAAVEELRETWPIHYLTPGGFDLGLDDK
jgi:hypothetical protein